jgi:hypothetical protein
VIDHFGFGEWMERGMKGDHKFKKKPKGSKVGARRHRKICQGFWIDTEAFNEGNLVVTNRSQPDRQNGDGLQALAEEIMGDLYCACNDFDNVTWYRIDLIYDKSKRLVEAARATPQQSRAAAEGEEKVVRLLREARDAMKVTDRDREYAKNLLDDLGDDGIEDSEIVAQWLCKVRVETLRAVSAPVPPVDGTLREWLVIESSYKNAVFASDDSKEPKGYIPRDAAEKLLGKDLGGVVWFTREESDKMREHPDWRETLPPNSAERFKASHPPRMSAQGERDPSVMPDCRSAETTVVKSADDWRGTLWRERLRDALNISSDLAHRSWRDIKRALAALSPSGTGAAEK